MDPKVLLSVEILNAYDNAERKVWAQQALQDDAFRNNIQWDLEAIKVLEARNQMPIVVNVIHPAVEQAKAMLTTNRPRFSSTGREDSDTRTGRMFSDLLTYIWDISLGMVQVKQAVDDYYVRGMGILYAYFDPNADFGNGEVKFSALDPFDVYIDPNSKDPFARDAQNILIVRVMTREQIQRMYPEVIDKLQTASRIQNSRQPVLHRVGLEGQILSANQSLDQEHEHYEIIDRYSRVKKKHYKAVDGTTNREKIFNSDEELQQYAQTKAVVKQSSGGEQVVTDPDDVAQLLQINDQTGGVFHFAQDPSKDQPTMVPGPEAEDEAAVQGSETRLTVCTIADLIHLKLIEIVPILSDRINRVLSVGGVLLYDGELPLEDFPIVPVYNRFNRNPYPMSDVRFVRPIQEYINKFRSLIIAHTANSSNVKAFIPRGSVNKAELEREWAKAGAALIEYDAEFGVPVIASPPPLPNELYKAESDARKDIQEILGIYPLMQGDSGQAPNTYKGTVAMDEYGQRRIKSKKDDVEQALNQMARVIVDMIQAFYTKPKVIRLLEPNHKPKEVSINQPIYNDVDDVIGVLNDVTIGRYDVVVVSGSMLPSNRWARFEYYMELYEKGIIDQIEVLKQTEVVDMEGVMNRFGEIQQLRQQVAGLTQQLKGVQGDLQTAQRESVQDRKRVEVEKFKTGLHSVRNRAEGAQELFKARLNDQLSNQEKAAKVEMQRRKMPPKK